MMVNSELLSAATALLNENAIEPPSDYEDRAPFLLGAFYAECEWLDRKYRAAHGLEADYLVDTLEWSLSDSFLFVPALTSAAIYYLASMLVMDENEKLGEQLFARYADAVSTVEAEIPFVKEKIKNVY